MWLPRANHEQKQDPPLDQLVDHHRPMTEGVQLVMPGNITVPLAPKCPELNLIENI